jgi:hypothetical protein
MWPVSLVNTWSRNARRSSLLQAVQRVGTSAEPVILDKLFEHAQEKADSLERREKSLGGHGLQPRAKVRVYSQDATVGVTHCGNCASLTTCTMS